MGTLSGTFLGSGIATTATGAQTAYRLVTPDKTVANLATIAQESMRWLKTVEEYRKLAAAGQLDYALVRRAQFAEEVLALMGTLLDSAICCFIVAQAADGKILGVTDYNTWGAGEGGIHLQAIAPEHLPGSPGVSQIRGVGSALVAAVSRDLLRRGTKTLYLHPLDNAARLFWMGRGFVADGGGGRMSIASVPGIERLIDGCYSLPDCTPGGECLLCGTMRMTEAVRLPANR